MSNAVRRECATINRVRANLWPNSQRVLVITESIYQMYQHYLANRATPIWDEHSLVPTIYQPQSPMEHRCGSLQPIFYDTKLYSYAMSIMNCVFDRLTSILFFVCTSVDFSSFRLDAVLLNDRPINRLM